MRLYILLLLPLFLSATPLSLLIQNAKDSHLSLKVIRQKIKAIDYEYQTTKNFSDPIVSLGMGDIQFQNPTNRSLEPMQFSAINFKQSIPFFGKRSANGKEVEAKKQIAVMDLQQTKVKLVEGIKITSYDIWQAEQLLRITNKYIDLTKQDIRLYSSYSSSDSDSHIQIITAELLLSELKIQKSNFSAIIKGLYKKLSYLSNMNVSHVKLNMQITKLKSLKYYLRLELQNKNYKLKKARLQEADADIKIKKLAYYPNPYVKVGYYHRQQFKDYASVTVGFSLPIYGTQRLNEQKSKMIALSRDSDVINFKDKLHSKIAQTYANLQNSYQVYQILSTQSIPQVQDMQNVSNAYIKSGTSLFVYIDTLKKQFLLDEQNIIAIASYHKRVAILDALIGKN